MRVPVMSVLITIVVLALAPSLTGPWLGGTALAQREPAPPARGSDDDRIPDHYIVVLRDTAPEPGLAASQLAQQHALTVGHVYRHALRGFSARIPAQRVAALQADSRVRVVVPDRRLRLFAQDAPTGLERIGASLDGLHQTAVQKGTGVGVAVLDTGVELNHPDLVPVQNGINCTGGGPSANDLHGHGTHVAGTIAARDNAIGVVGVAPEVTLYAVQVLDANGEGSLSTFACGVDWVTGNAGPVGTPGRIQIANISGGGPETSTPSNPDCTNGNNDVLHTAICQSVQAGVTYVVAAGNSGADASGFVPAAYDEVITVSALTDFNGRYGSGAGMNCFDGFLQTDDTLASFSNYGAPVDIAAPGVCINSTYLGGTYAQMSGTSMASPHVAGAAALYKQAYPAATPAQVKAGLLAGQEPAPIPFDPDGFKEGVVHLPLVPTALPLRVNAGGAAFTDGQGRAWSTDVASGGGFPYSTTAAIGGTTDDALYQSERYGNFLYSVVVPNGTYSITLKFAEIYFTSPGQRLFQVAIEGQPVLSSFDILAEVPPMTALDKSFTVAVSDGVLDVLFTSQVNNAKLAAIEIAPGAAGTPTPTATATAGPSPTPTATPTFGPSPTPTATPPPTATATPTATRTATATPTPPSRAILSASPGTTVAGGTVTVSWTDVPSPSAQNRFGLYEPGAADGSPLAWKNTTGLASGSTSFTIPAGILPGVPLAPGTYELRLFADGFSGLLALAPMTVTACTGATLAPSPTGTLAGGTVTASWSGICGEIAGSQNRVGLYAPGESDGAPIVWKSTSGTPSGSTPFTVPAGVAPGAYELRLFTETFNGLLATAPLSVSSCTGATVMASPASTIAGATVAVSWTGICAEIASVQHRAGLYASGAPHANPLAWRNLAATADGSAPFTVPATVAAGSYELRLFTENFNGLLATAPVNVASCTAASVSPSPASMVAGGSITVTWTGICAEIASVQHRAGLYTPGAPPTSPLGWRNLDGTASGSTPFTVPATVAAGSYELRLFTESFNGLLATAPLTVTACTGVTVSASPPTVAAGGTFVAGWSDVCGEIASTQNRLGLYATGMANGSPLAWKNTTGASSGTMPFTVPATMPAGGYELRLFAESFSGLLATTPIAVTAPTTSTPTATATTAAPTPTATATPAPSATPTPSPTATPVAPMETATASHTPLSPKMTATSMPTAPSATVTATPTPSAPSPTMTATPTPTPSPTPGNGATLDVSPPSAIAGASVTVSWAGISSPSTQNRVGLYALGAANGSPLVWKATTGTGSGSMPFTVPASAAAGAYELRLFTSSFTGLLATTPVTVTACTGVSLGASPTSVPAGGVLTASWGGICATIASPQNRLGLYAPGAANGSPLGWKNATGAATGTTPFTVPAAVAPGTYELRLFTETFNGLLATTPVTVTACTGVTLSASPTSVVAGGALTASWAGICTAIVSPQNRLGLYAPGAPNGSPLAWKNATGTASGSTALTVPASVAPGSYELRLFTETFNGLLATAPVTVTACTGVTLGASPTSVPAGGTLTASWAGICTAIVSSQNRLGLYAPGAPNGSPLAWKNATGVASGSTALTVPASVAAGSYQLRLFTETFNGLLATTPVTVTATASTSGWLAADAGELDQDAPGRERHGNVPLLGWIRVRPSELGQDGAPERQTQP